MAKRESKPAMDPRSQLREKLATLEKLKREASRLAGGASHSDLGQAHRERAAERSRQLSASVAEIGPIPAVKHPKRKASCKNDLLKFLTTYFPQSTGLSPFSADHVRIIKRLERCIITGGRSAAAVYRGWAKTTIGENAVLWATMYGHRRFVPLLGADAEASDGNLHSIKMELYGNELLAEDFPEVCFPIRALENKPQRALMQTCNGKSTHIGWTASGVSLPWIPGAASAGASIVTAGIMSVNRGLKHKLPDGKQQRPDFVFIDDPQTDDSAATPAQVRKRMMKLQKTILKLAGHNRPLAVFVTGTIIQPDDMMDQLLDPQKSPAWQGERVPMVKSWSKAHEKFWLGAYAHVRSTFDRNDIADRDRARSDATELYRQRRTEADEGAVIAWDSCYEREHGEISALQHAYNILIDDGAEAFASECQNQPLTQNRDDEFATAEDISTRTTGVDVERVPPHAMKLTAMIDVQGHLLYWGVVAWNAQFGGQVIAYGTYPDQKKAYYTYREASITLDKAHKGMGVAGATYAGLMKLISTLCERQWQSHDGGSAYRIERLNIDAGGADDAKNIVYDVCRDNPHAAILTPTFGRGIGASSQPMGAWKREPGEEVGHNWRRRTAKNEGVRYGLFDANSWKTFVHRRLMVPLGDPEALTFHKAPAGYHRMFAEHLTAETPIRTSGQGRELVEWKHVNKNRDNHFFDVLVGCAVAGSMAGMGTVGHASPKAGRSGRRFKLSELQRSASR